MLLEAISRDVLLVRMVLWAPTGAGARTAAWSKECQEEEEGNCSA